MGTTHTFRVRFATSEPDVCVDVPANATIAAVIQQVRRHKGLDKDSKHVRIISGGKELFPDDPVEKSVSRVVHCMVSDVAPVPRGAPPAPRKPAPPLQPHPQPVDQPPVDWLDVVDPGAALKWIFGSILALLWLIFLFYAHMFDRTSVLMLCMMTVAFLIPCALSCIPWPASLQRRLSPRSEAARQPEVAAVGHSTAVPPPAPAPAPWQRHAYNDVVPPRPQARVRPPGAH